MVPTRERTGNPDQDLRGFKPVSQHYIQIVVSPALTAAALMILKIDSSFYLWERADPLW